MSHYAAAPAEASPRTSNTASFSHFSIAAAWLGLGILALLVDLIFEWQRLRVSAFGLSVLSLSFGVWLFLRHGGRVITSVGVYAFASACFVGFPGIYSFYDPKSLLAAEPFGLEALSACYFVNVITWALFWARSPATPVMNYVAGEASASRWIAKVGAVLLFVAVLFRSGGRGENPLILGAGYVGALMIGVWSIRSGRKMSLIPLVVALAALGLYVDYLFVGFGRIVLATLAFSILAAVSHRYRSPALKPAILAGTVPLVVLMAQVRLDAVAAMYPGAHSDETGMESMITPLTSLAALLNFDHHGALPYSYGKTFLVATIVLIPRTLWPGKPVGFGAELVPLLSPELVGTGQSEAALFFGEFLYNFGLWGFLIMIPVVGIGLRAADSMLVRTVAQGFSNRILALQYIASLIVACGVVDVFWGGAFTYSSRVGPRLLVLAVFFLLLGPKAATISHRGISATVHAGRQYIGALRR